MSVRSGNHGLGNTADSALTDSTVTTFPGSRDTLYLLSKEGAGAAAPLVAALTDAVFRTAVVHAEAAGGRIDPPVLAVLDEAANICKINDCRSSTAISAVEGSSRSPSSRTSPKARACGASAA
ncbi:hypothetical protein [Salinispora arenicola]|uniref:hypothetical protein n=1 Tax=Salinispora arenicola TaxID=168697 RepID=UPI0027DB4BEF|nr:hypothetical protein [Salinispora arenicola]